MNALNAANQFGASAQNQGALTNATNNLSAQQFNAGQLQNYLGQIPNALGSQTAAGSTQQQVGQQLQDYDQALINEQIKAFNYNQQAPLNTLKSTIGFRSSSTSCTE